MSGGEDLPPETAEDEDGRAAKPFSDRRMLEILVCPIARESLIYDRIRGELVSRQARLAYPIRDGVPIMVPSEARLLEDDERAGFGPPSQIGRPSR